MARDYAAVPHAYREEMSDLSDAEFGRLIRALLKYSETGETMALRGNERFFAKRVMAEEDRHRKSYEDTVSARSRAGVASGAARTKRTEVNKRQQTKDININLDPEKETNSLFSYEKRRSARCRAPAETGNDDSWMNAYD